MNNHELNTSSYAKSTKPWLRMDAILGAVLSLVALIFLFYLVPNYIEEPKSVNSIMMSPRFVPNIAGWGILLLSVLLTLQSLRSTTNNKTTPFINTPALRWILMLATFVIYTFFFEWLGAIASAFIASSCLLLANYVRQFWLYVLMLVFPILVFLLFVYVLHVPLPWGDVWL